MKSKTSFFNKAVFKRNMTGGAALWAGFVTVYIIVLPLILYYTLNDGHWIQELAADARIRVVDHAVMEHLWNQSIFVPMYAAAALITAMHLFSYLFTSRSSNMMHTYPVSRTGLFCTNYISGMIYLTVPQVFASLLALLVGIFSGATAVAVKSWFVWIGVSFVENLFFFSLSVCVLMFAGNIVAVPVLYLIINFLYRGMLLIFEAMVETACYGVRGIGGHVIGVLTPVIYMSNTIGVHISSAGDGYEYEMWGKTALLGYLAAAVLLALAAWAAYQKKQIETAGDVITVEWMKPIFRWGTAVCTSALGAVFFEEIFHTGSFVFVVIFGIISGAAAFFISQMLLERSFRVFSSKRIREGILFSAAVCVCYVALDADVLGYEKIIPSEDKINGVRVYASGLNLFAASDEEIAWTRDLHKQIIDSKKEFEAYQRTDGVYSSVGLEYILKDGTQLRRTYYIPDLEADESVSGQIDAYARQPEVILKEYFGIHYPAVEVYGGRLGWYDTEYYMHDNSEIRLSEAEAEKLFEAVVKDAEAGNFSHVDDSGETLSDFGSLMLEVRDEQGFLSIRDGASGYFMDGAPKDGYVDIWLDSSFKHVIKVIDDLGYLSDGLREVLAEGVNAE